MRVAVNITRKERAPKHTANEASDVRPQQQLLFTCVHLADQCFTSTAHMSTYSGQHTFTVIVVYEAFILNHDTF